MEIQVAHESGRVPITVFRIQGDIDTKTYGELETKAREAYGSGTRNLLLDLSNVRYISSAGLRAIHTIFNLLKGDMPQETDEAMKKGLRAGTFKSPHLKLLSPSKSIKEVLTISGYDMFLEIHEDYKKALASF